MSKTVVQIDVNLRDELRSFGSMGETYNDVIAKLITSHKQRQTELILLDTTEFVDVNDVV